MKHAVENAFPLPMNQFYSTFVEIQGSKQIMFARYEVHHRVACTKDYIIEKEEESKVNFVEKGEKDDMGEIADKGEKAKKEENLAKPKQLQFKEES